MVKSKERIPTDTKEEKSAFIVCNEDEGWFLLRAGTLDEAVSKARDKGKEPEYVVEEKLSTKIR